MALDNTLESSTFAFSRYVDQIAYGQNLGKGYLLSNFVSFGVSNSKFLDMVEPFSARTFEMPRFRFIQPSLFLLKKAYLDSVIPFLAYRFLLQNRTRSSLNDGYRYSPAIFVVHATHSNFPS